MCGETGIKCIAGGNIEWCCHCGKSGGKAIVTVLHKVKTELPYKSSNSTPALYSEDLKAKGSRIPYTLNVQKAKLITEMSINK